MWRGEEAEYGYGWERSREVKEVSLWKSSCCHNISRHASQLPVEGKIHDTWTIELLKWEHGSFMPYSRNVM